MFPMALALAASLPSAPSWTKDLIIYEIAPKGFTSPNGPESGTFRSLQEKLPYLKKLGINGIWLTGHSEAPPHVFYNIWSQYANVEPDKIEPTLGTPNDLKSLVQAAHRNGIRIFLDVHEHGLHPSSPIVAKHPEWFKGDAGGMCDFDFAGDHKDRDEWWVGVWTDCVKRYGVDGFRIDMGIERPDLWIKIRQNAAAAGHPIAVFGEEQNAIPGASDFSQGTVKSTDLRDDVSNFYENKFLRASGAPPSPVATLPSIQFSCHDQSWEGWPADQSPYSAQGSRAYFGYSCLFAPMIPIFFAGDEFDATFRPIPWESPRYLEPLNGESMQDRLSRLYKEGSPSNVPKTDKGKGRWLYGNMLDWSEPEHGEHKEMFDDVERMIAIRKAEAGILSAVSEQVRPNLTSVACVGDVRVPEPYIRWDDHAAILIAANRDTGHDAHLLLDVPLDKIGFGSHFYFKVTDLWLGGAEVRCTARQLKTFSCEIKRDKTPRGGLRVFKIEPQWSE